MKVFGPLNSLSAISLAPFPILEDDDVIQPPPYKRINPFTHKYVTPTTILLARNNSDEKDYETPIASIPLTPRLDEAVDETKPLYDKLQGLISAENKTVYADVEGQKELLSDIWQFYEKHIVNVPKEDRLPQINDFLFRLCGSFKNFLLPHELNSERSQIEKALDQIIATLDIPLPPKYPLHFTIPPSYFKTQYPFFQRYFSRMMSRDNLGNTLRWFTYLMSDIMNSEEPIKSEAVFAMGPGISDTIAYIKSQPPSKLKKAIKSSKAEISVSNTLSSLGII